MREDHVGERVPADLDEALRAEQRLDLFLRFAHQEWQLVADRRVFDAAPRAVGLFLAGRDQRVPVDHREPSTGPQYPDPFADRRPGMRQRPQHVAGDHQVEARRREWQVLGIGLLESDRSTGACRFLLRQGQHRRREIDAGDAVTARRQFQRQKPGAAADIERLKAVAAAYRQREHAVPRRALFVAADAMAEIRVEIGRPPAPMRGDILLDDIGRRHGDLLLSARFFSAGYFNPTTSASASTCST